MLNVIFAGVGGQGVLTASEVMARAALMGGLDCKKSEVHGMAQRGGSVESQVRAGARVHSPLIPAGCADYLVAFEKLEALRHAHKVKPGGVVILNLFEAPGCPDGAGTTLGSLGLRVLAVPGRELGEKAGDIRSMGLVLLGALSNMLPFEAASWEGAIKETFKPGAAAVNIRAFLLGCDPGLQDP